MADAARLHWVMLLGLIIPGCARGPAKFVMVGMGTAPDLATIRAIETVRRADIVLLGDEQEREDFKQYIQGKEVWIAPRFITLYMGVDPKAIRDEDGRRLAIEHARKRQEMLDRIASAVRSGRTVASLENGDAMMYGITYYLEALPPDIPTEVVPGVGAFEAAAAAVKRSPPYGWDTSSVILTMSDWQGRVDTNERLMATGTSMVFYTMHLDYPKLMEQLGRHYAPDTPVAVVSYAGDPKRQEVIRSTVGGFLKEVDLSRIPVDKHMLLVGKFLTCGQARADGLEAGRRYMERMKYQNREQEAK
ncbi:MAG: hypothetical protein JXQ73_31335 [Phycisphaerae bacterium]|nr:hypothetical protein [Phycisphaerae bacterium]